MGRWTNGSDGRTRFPLYEAYEALERAVGSPIRTIDGLTRDASVPFDVRYGGRFIVDFESYPYELTVVTEARWARDSNSVEAVIIGLDVRPQMWNQAQRVTKRALVALPLSELTAIGTEYYRMQGTLQTLVQRDEDVPRRPRRIGGKLGDQHYRDVAEAARKAHRIRQEHGRANTLSVTEAIRQGFLYEDGSEPSEATVQTWLRVCRERDYLAAGELGGTPRRTR